MIVEGIQILNQNFIQHYKQSISICLYPGTIATLFSINNRIDENAVDVAKKTLGDYFKERGLTDIKITVEFENGKKIRASELYSKIIEKNSSSTPFSQSQYNCKKSKKEQIVKEIEKVINENYSKPLTVESIAKMIHFTPNYIGLIFKTEKKISINHYIMIVRLQKAEELLANENIHINDIAMQCGYENTTYFHTTFKKEIGITPSEYRQRILQKFRSGNTR